MKGVGYSDFIERWSHPIYWAVLITSVLLIPAALADLRWGCDRAWLGWSVCVLGVLNGALALAVLPAEYRRHRGV